MSKKSIKPIMLLIIGIVSLISAITGIVLIITGISKLELTFIIGLYMFALSLIICIPCLTDGLRQIKTLQREKKNTITQNYTADSDTYPTDAPSQDTNEIAQAIKDIVIETIEQNTVNTSEGKKPVKYCTECGCAIDKNSNFCKICGKEQD